MVMEDTEVDGRLWAHNNGKMFVIAECDGEGCAYSGLRRFKGPDGVHEVACFDIPFTLQPNFPTPQPERVRRTNCRSYG